MKPYAPPPPPGAQPPPFWGNQDLVPGLFGDRVTDIAARTDAVTVETVSATGGFPRILQLGV